MDRSIVRSVGEFRYPIVGCQPCLFTSVDEMKTICRVLTALRHWVTILRVVGSERCRVYVTPESAVLEL